MVTVIWVVAVSSVAFGLFFSFFASYRIFFNTLYRSEKKAKTRECSNVDDEGIKYMFEQGCKWAEEHKDKIEELHIVSDGLNLYGEYVDFGCDRCAIIVQGRTESLLFSYYFADIYAENGYNIFVMDIRTHGLSDGKYITAGIREHKDMVLWIDMIKNRYSMESFLIHGLCIGSAVAIYTHCATKKDNLIKKLVLDGTYTNYYEMFKNHMIERKKPVLFFVHLTFFYVHLLDGANLLKETPYKRVGEIDIPVLFIWSRKDIYCLEEKNRDLFAACKSENKEMRLFPNGGHSYVRLSNKEDYDKAVVEFLKK
ncbi:MAG: lysophospholipase [Oscillospiraceae bacterium]|nr:lysophospholipase [Oscillospiraceae bacterium]